MDSNFNNNSNANEPAPRVLIRIGRFLFPLIAIACGIVLTMWLVNTKPKAKQRPRLKNTTFVSVEKARLGTHTIRIESMGTIIPAKSITVAAEVTGKVTTLSPSFYPGGLFAKDAAMASIDPRNYKLALRQNNASLLSAQAALSIEGGNQMVAKKEFELLGEKVSAAEKALMLRTPQLNQLQADLENAKASYSQAQLNLDRTTINAPFNGMLQDITTNTGSYVGAGTSLGSFVGTDDFWLELLIPVADLQWINIPKSNSGAGSSVRIFNSAAWGNTSRDAHIVGLMAALETNGRLAKILVRINDPLALLPENKGKPRVLLDSYVRAEITGMPIDNAIAVDRSYIHDGDTIWIMTPEGSLEIRKIFPVFKDQSRVIINANIEPNELYITSSIAAPVDGMLLQKKDQPQQKQALKAKG